MNLPMIVVYIVGPIAISPKKCFQHHVRMCLDLFPTSLAELELVVRKELEKSVWKVLPVLLYIERDSLSQLKQGGMVGTSPKSVSSITTWVKSLLEGEEWWKSASKRFSVSPPKISPTLPTFLHTDALMLPDSRQVNLSRFMCYSVDIARFRFLVVRICKPEPAISID